ncbi:hypothetical protein FB446DRAFT_738320 [Lentinula raphanica]|nr:hypothetical protein FB446DRAFT_738320 [Lentinula raphanica]
MLSLATTGVILIAITGYLLTVRAHRWRRHAAIHHKYQHKYESGLLTPAEAQEIIGVSTLYDMPALTNYALAFALFKTYAIPTISKILSDTKELKSSDTMSKRYADTEILISTWVFCPITGKSSFSEQLSDVSLHDSPEMLKKGPTGSRAEQRELDDPRAMIALARVNWLHSKYPITNDDYLYTLALFTFEPPKWVRLYGWRPLSPMEEEAFYIFWYEIGKRMGIRDIPETIHDYRKWVKEYEARAMVPAQTNHEVATYTTEEILHVVPEFLGLRSLFRKLSVCALEENVRIAMMKPEQPVYYHLIFRTVLRSIAFVQRFLCLPRSDSNHGAPIDFSIAKNTGPSSRMHRMHPNWFQAKPWYMPQPRTFSAKLKNWVAVKLGLYDAFPEPKFKSEGYRLEEMGPAKFEKSGNEEVIRMAEQFYGCPISGPFSRK